MRTTIRIGDMLHRRVKQVADRFDRTIGQVTEDAIQVAFRPTPTAVFIAHLPVEADLSHRRRADGKEPRRRATAAGDDDVLALGHAPKQPREVVRPSVPTAISL